MLERAIFLFVQRSRKNLPCINSNNDNCNVMRTFGDHTFEFQAEVIRARRQSRDQRRNEELKRYQFAPDYRA